MFLATSLVLQITAIKRRRYFIGTTGASCILFTSGKFLAVKYTTEGDRLFFNEHVNNKVTYGLICVEMKNLYTLQEAQDILVNYLQKAQAPFAIAHTIHLEMTKEKTSVSAADYWQDKSGADWKIKAQTNGKLLSILYVKNVAETSVSEHDYFLDSFRFS